MTQDRNGSLLHSLLLPFRKAKKHDEPETQESRQRLEQRIELALGGVIECATDLASAAPIPQAASTPGPR
jgi:hypothetical protein